MDDFFSKFLDLRKIPTELFVLVSILTGTFLFLPDTLLSKLNIQTFEADYGKYFGIVFLISTGILAIKIVKWIYKKISSKWVRNKNKNKVISYLSSLDPSEQSVLREFYIANQKSLDLPYDDPVVRNLIRNGIIIKISEIGSYQIGGLLYPMKISDFLNNNITGKNLGTAEFQTNEDKSAYIARNRPKWAYEIEKFK